MTHSDFEFWGVDVPMGIMLFTLVFSCVFAAFRLFFNILKGKFDAQFCTNNWCNYVSDNCTFLGSNNYIDFVKHEIDCKEGEGL